MQMTRAEKRLGRATAPEMMEGSMILNVDGAARKSEDGFKSSCGACLYVNGNIVAKKGLYLGSKSNNVAEYEGFGSH